MGPMPFGLNMMFQVTCNTLYVPIRMHVIINCFEQLVTPCACAAGGRVIGLSVSLSIVQARLSSEGLVEGLFQDRSVRIQKILAST